MVRSGDRRRRMARILKAAYGDGLLSEATFAHRLDLLFGSSLIEPDGLVGDLSFRAGRRRLADGVLSTVAALRGALGPPALPAALLALDWASGPADLLIGRHPECDLVVSDASVSRRHAQLRFRDGRWVLRDLDSTNGSTVNGRPVIRCQLRPGDRLMLGDAALVVD